MHSSRSASKTGKTEEVEAQLSSQYPLVLQKTSQTVNIFDVIVLIVLYCSS